MFKRRDVRIIAVLSLLTVGAVATHLMGGTGSIGPQTRWGIFAPQSAEAAGTIYVDASATGAGTGLSWADAYTTLQQALSGAVSGDVIWVAAGVYYPDEGGGMTNNDQSSMFTLLNGVEVYGGFVGGESSLSQRAWETNITVLSGDIDKNDTTDPNGVVTDSANIAGSNAYHVLTGGGTGSSAVLDGFTITAGHAIGSSPDDRGGGMYNHISNPTLTNVTFSGNEALEGGGMYNNSSSPTLTNVTFSGKNAANFGGGIYNRYSNPTLTNVTFYGNQVQNYGGGMYNYIDCNLTLTNVSFTGNQAARGGGIYNFSNSNPTLTNVTFSGNYASTSGGGMYNDSSSPTLTNVSFTGNRARFVNGGGMYNDSSNPTLTNTILWNNQASSSGHQIYNSSSTPTISSSDIQGSGGSGSWDTALGTDGGNNIDADPLFVTPVDPATTPTTAGDLHLQRSSQAVDAGDNGACPTTDLDGNTRPIDGDLDGVAVCDMGTYEKLIDLFLPLISR